MAAHTGPREDEVPESWEERHEVDDGNGKPPEVAMEVHEAIQVEREENAPGDHSVEVNTSERRSTKKPEASGSQGEVSATDEVPSEL